MLYLNVMRKAYFFVLYLIFVSVEWKQRCHVSISYLLCQRLLPSYHQENQKLQGMKLSQIAKDDSFSAIKFCEIKKLHAVMLSTCHSHILWYETFFKS